MPPNAALVLEGGQRDRGASFQQTACLDPENIEAYACGLHFDIEQGEENLAGHWSGITNGKGHRDGIGLTSV